MRKLVIGNKCYSSWSLRPWLLLKHLHADFDEVVVPLDTPEFKTELAKYGGAGKVPLLVDGETVVWESISIMDYVADAWNVPVWPRDIAARTLARSMVCEMHAGFTALRSACPMNLGKRYAARDRGAALAADVARIEELFRMARGRFGGSGPFLFGTFSAADAMYAPIVTRLNTYAIPVAEDTRAYMDTILTLPAFKRWLSDALNEPWVVDADEVAEQPIAILRNHLRH